MKNVMIKAEAADSDTPADFQDNRGRRVGIDRRNFSYSLYVPERRAGRDRRNGKDRRKTPRMQLPVKNNCPSKTR
jgi:hypothetical protein